MIDTRQPARVLLAAFIFFLVALSLFLLTAAPGMDTDDSGEFTGGVRLLTMVHAPGYPLYLIVGRLFTALSPWPGRGLVIFSACTAAATVGLFFLVLARRLSAFAAACGAASLMLAEAFWRAAITVEVYALQVFFLVAIFGLLLELRDHPNGRLWRLFGLTLGLALAHHIGLLIHLPLIALYLAWTFRRARPKATDLAAAAGYAASGLCLYAALLLLSWRGEIPVISWQPIRDLPLLLHVATGAGFKRQLFAVPLPRMLANLGSFPLQVAFWFPFFAVLAALSGLVTRWREAARDRPVIILLAAMFAVTILHASGYQVLDPDRFLIPTLLPIAVAAAWGAEWLAAHFLFSRAWRIGLAAGFIISSLGARLATGQFLNEARQTTTVDLCRAVLDELAPANAADTVVLWSDWSYFPALRTLQLVERRGAGVVIVMDSTAATPGDSFLPGRTYTMQPSRELGREYALTMTGLAWRVDTAVTAPDSPAAGTTLISFGGLGVSALETPAQAVLGRAFTVTVHLRRDSGPASDTVAGELLLLRDGLPRLRTPFAVWRWHVPPDALLPGKDYVETVSSFVPTGYRFELERQPFTLAITLRDARGKQRLELGPLRVVGSQQ